MLMPFFSPVTAAGPAVLDFHAFGADTDGWIRGIVTGDGDLTFARSSTATVPDWEGLVKTVLANELRIKEARRVENLLPHTADFSGWDVSNGVITYNQSDPDGGTNAAKIVHSGTILRDDYIAGDMTGRYFVNSVWLKGELGTESVRIYGPDNTFVIKTLSTNWQRFSKGSNGAASWSRFQIYSSTSVTVYVYLPQAEEATGQTNQNPSEGISVGVESGDYHGLGVDGVACFAYENGNTVASNVVTEAKGSDLTTDWGALYEPAATNYSDTDDDLSGGAETVDLTSPGTGDYTLSIYGSAAVTVAAGTATGTGFAQATEGSDVTFNLSVAGTVTLTLDSGTLDTHESAAMKQVEKASASSSFIPASGGGVSRTADDGDGAFAFSNFDITKGTFVFDLMMDAEVDQGIINFANAEAGLVSYDTTNKFQTDDGTNQANVDPTLGSNLGDRIRIAIGYDSSLFIGYKNITDAGAFVWDTDSASFDGGFASNSVLNILYDLAGPSRMRDLYYYSEQLSKATIEANH